MTTAGRKRNSNAKKANKKEPSAGTTNTGSVAYKSLEVASKTSGTAITSPTAAAASDWETLSQWTPESVQEVAGWWNLDEKGVAQLWQLYDRLQDVEHWKNQPNEVVRYLRESKGDVQRAEQRFRTMVQWRIDQQVDNIVHDYEMPHPLMAEYLPTTVLEACDKDGDPIWVERVGAADSLGLLKTFGQADLIRYAVYIREVCIRGEWAKDYQQRHGQPPSRATAIIDLGGLGWDHCKPSLLPMLKEGLQIIQDYYVGFGKKVIVIRVSKLFPIVWQVAQHFCGERLKEMMVFATADNYLEVLEDYVDLESLPSCIYPEGKGQGGVGMPAKRLDGGKVPSWDELDRLWADRQNKEGVPDVVKASGLSTSTSSFTDSGGSSVTSSPAKSIPSSPARSIASTLSTLSSGTSKDPQNILQPEKWSNDNFQTMMQRFDATNQEESQIRDMQSRLADVDHWKNSPQTCMYFLRDSHHNAKLAEKRFRQMIQWRLNNNVDHHLETYTPPKLLLEYFSATILRPDCCDHDGDPIYVERPGASDSWALYQRFHKKGIVDYITWMRETAARGTYGDAYEDYHGKRILQLTCIVDCQGLSARHMKPGLLPLFKSIMEVSQNHYCGMAKRIFVIRAPRIFQLIWSLTHHFLSQQIKDLLVFCSSDDYLDVMGEYMDINHLPPCIYEHGRGEGGPGMPKKLDLGRLPSPTDHDYDLATERDVDPYEANQRAARATNASVNGARLGGGVFDFKFPAEENENAETVVTLAR